VYVTRVKKFRGLRSAGRLSNDDAAALTGVHVKGGGNRGAGVPVMTRRTTAVLSEAILAASSGGRAVLSDRELLGRFVHAGDQQAFTTLFRRHSSMVLGVCRRALPTVQDAEDACQATFLVLSRKASSGRWQPSIANWLYLTARRVARNARVIAERRIRREGQAAERKTAQPVDRMTGRELLDALDDELDNLPAAYRAPLVLCYLEGLTRDEAAARLGVPSGTLKIRLERARKRLGNALAKRGCVAGAGLLVLAATSSAGASPLRLIDAVLAAATGSPSTAVAKLAEGVVMNGLVNKSLVALLLLAGAAALGFGLASATPPAARQPLPDDQAPAAEAKHQDQAKPAADLPGTRLVSGRVLTPDGKPVSGAKLFVPVLKTARPVSIEDLELNLVGASRADGRFTVSVSPVSMDVPRSFAIAYAPGFGVDWLQFDPNASGPIGEQTLQLPEDLPIVGRLVNTEGRPLAGASISADTISVPPDGKLDNYLAAWRKDIHVALSSPRKGLPASLTRIIGPTTSDRDGRFTIRGAGAERIVELSITGAGLARSKPYIVTRRGFDPKPYNDVLLSKDNNDLRVLNRFPGLYAPEFTFVVEAGKEISGIVTDSVTGQLVPGCRLFSSTGYGDGVAALSDARGRYRLEGLPKNGKEFRVSVEPPEESEYLGQNVRVYDTDGFAPVRLDVRLGKASAVKGRVLDKQTGKGVQASIRLAPMPNNKLFGTRPEFSRYATDRTVKETDPDGRFRLVTIPGPALVMVQVGARELLYGEHLCRYRRAVPDPAYKELFRHQGDGSWTIVTAGNGTEFLNTENVVKVIDVKNTGETEVDLFVDPGVTGKITVQGGEGQPLSGAWVAGLSDHFPITYRLPEATATVYSLDPATPRTLALYHAGGHLGGTVTVRGDEKEPVVARLGPLARVTGRLLDGDGQPIAGMTVSVSANREVFQELYRFANVGGNPARTDKSGRFTLEELLPEMSFNFGFHKGNEYYVGKPKIGSRKLKPGESLDLGDRTLEPSR
jgi:RNA polymerase sigma factor (sigma-70 family)